MLGRAGMILGTVGCVTSVGAIHAARHDYGFTDTARFAWSLTYAVLLVVAGYGVGLPELVDRTAAAVGSAVRAVAIAAVAISAVQLFAGDALLPRFVVFGSAALLVPWYVLMAAVADRGRASDEARARVLLIGSPQEAELLRRDLLIGCERPAQLVGDLAVEDALAWDGSNLAMCNAATRTGANVIVLTREALLDERLVHQAAILHESGLRLRTLTMFYEQWLGKLPIAELERTSLLFDISEVHRLIYARVTRVADVLLGVAGLPLVVLVAGVLLLVNPVANRGPLFYRQQRVGKNGKLFTILKFRTMRPQGTRLINEWTTEDDPRITSVGRVLRQAHLDELPQLLNVLRGELSLVGPRPEQPHYVEELVAKLPFYELRHLVRPGLTGWAQVNYGYAGNESDSLEKLQYDFYYLRHQSLLLDTRILVRTIRSVLRRRGR